MTTKNLDLFGIMGAPAPDEVDANADDTELPDYVVLQLIPADGWRAVFSDGDGDAPRRTRTLGLAGFVLAELVGDLAPGVAPMRVVRPMAVDEHGEINDVAYFEDFICLVPPGGDVDQTVRRVIEREREREREA